MICPSFANRKAAGWKLGGHTWVGEAYGAIINELVLEFEETDL